ncbi:MAG: homocysteine S-methyltransferase family protein [Phycisphaerae bacterium]
MESEFLRALEERVLVFDGAMGTNVHRHELPLSDYNGLENCTEILNLTRPDVIRGIHASFLDVGCDAIETNTFGANKVVFAEFGLVDRVYEINRRAARIAREVAAEFGTSKRPRFVVGSMGPGTKLPSLRHTTWDVLEDSYAEQARGLLDGGVDVLLIETCQDILQAKAAIAGIERAMAEKGRRVPIMVQVTMETTGTMLVGTDMAAAVVAIEAYPQVEVFGLNCATGPEQMSEHVRYLSANWPRKISVLPNAGLPQLVDGRPHYPLTPAELARWLKEFVEVDGVNIVGGCCGTTPEHLRAVVEAIGDAEAKRRHEPFAREEVRPRGGSPPDESGPGQGRVPDTISFEPSVSSLYQAVPIRQDNSFLIVGERTNANGSRKFRRLLEAEDFDGMVEMAKEQVRDGSHVIDVCAAYVGRDERHDMTRLISRLATEVTVPLMIDSTEPPVIEASLKLCGGRCIVNSVNLEDGEKRCAAVLPMCRKYGAAVVALTIDEEGMAKTADRKVAIARRIFDLATRKYGMRPGDLLFDPLTFTICTGNEEDRRLAIETLEAVERIRKELPGCYTSLGVSNVSFGIDPAARHVLNSVFLHYACERGLDAAIVHASGITPLFQIDEKQREAARRLIFDERDGGDPLQAFLAMFVGEKPRAKRATAVDRPVEERLRQRIIDGDRTGLEADLDEAMKAYPPLEIINRFLLDGMKVVGELFGAGQMQLPFVLQSAETMKAAVRHLEKHMEKIEGGSKGRIVLATVKGDVHDIGKNLVDILLTNNGYTVYNLGIKQPINSIIDAWQQHRADAIGMSGLLVKSTLVMRENLEVLNERGLTPTVILGGAALTRRYVEQDLRAIYKGPLAYARDAFEGLSLMERIISGSGFRVPGSGAERVPASGAEGSGETEATDLAAALPEYQALKSETPTPGPGPRIPEPESRRSAIATDVPIPRPPFWGSRVLDRIPLSDALAYLNEVMLFQVHWGFKKKGRPAGEFAKYLDEHVRPIYRDLLGRCEREGLLQPRAIYGYWPCNSEGDSLIVYDAAEQDREVVRFTFPRQGRPPYWCLSDFFRPVESGEKDVVAFSIVTVGQQASDTAREWFKQDRYSDYLYLHGLSVETAEALAEYIHKRVRVELGIAGRDAGDIQGLFKQGYQGSRYSFGYAACPRLEDQQLLWPLLEPGRIGVTLTEEFQLVPEQSTSAMICHHPEARYFKA